MRDCRAGTCCHSVGEIKSNYYYVKLIDSRSGGNTYHVIQARDGYYAFVRMNGKFYATAKFPSLESLEEHIF